MEAKKKGFTLIELLATIVVIAVISLIAVPVVISVIEKANLASFKRSAESIRRISKNYYASNSTEYSEFDNVNFACNNSECISNLDDIKHKNLGATGAMGNGYVKIYKKGDIEFLLSNGKYCAEKNIVNDEIKYYKGNCEGIVIDLDKVKIDNLSTISTTKSILVKVEASAGKSGISGYKFAIDGKWTDFIESTDTSYEYIFGGLTTKNHKIKVRVYNGTYNSPNYDESIGMAEKEIDASLLDFGTITITPSTTGWAASKTYTVSGTTSGANLQYKVVSGTTIKQDWIDYDNEIKVDWESTVKTPTYIYARFNDGINTSDEIVYTETKIDITEPVLTIGNITTTTKSINIPITKSEDLESGIKSTTCEYGTSTSYGSAGTINGNSCIIGGIKNNTKYYYKITVTNNAGLNTEQTGNNTTNNFGTITITPSTTGWTTSKTYTISGTTSGANLQYKVVSGKTIKQDWTNYSSAITVDWASHTSTPTYIYARFNDGINTSDELAYTETKIDTTAPILTLGNVTNTTKSMIVPITVSDGESGIKSITCVYGLSTSYGSTGIINGNSCVISGIKNNTKYYYKVVATNNVGLNKEQTGSSTTNNFGTITITPSTTGWMTSKTYTVSGTTSGASLQYKVVSGTTVKQNWTNYSNVITVNWASNTSIPTYIYTRFNDGVNTSAETIYTETKIDTTAPTLILGTASVEKDKITVPITASDGESGIKGTSCVYGLSTSYGSTGTMSGSSCIMSGLNSSTSYYYKITTTNNAGSSTSKTGNSTTDNACPTTSASAYCGCLYPYHSNIYHEDAKKYEQCVNNEPNIVTFVVTNATVSSISVKATATNAVKYEFKINNGEYVNNGTTNTYTFNNLTAGTHTVYVRVTNSYGLTVEKSLLVSTTCLSNVNNNCGGPCGTGTYTSCSVSENGTCSCQCSTGVAHADCVGGTIVLTCNNGGTYKTGSSCSSSSSGGCTGDCPSSTFDYQCGAGGVTCTGKCYGTGQQTKCYP